MRRGIRLGNVLGISLNLDWSWFLIGALIAWSFGTLYANDLVPGLRTSAHAAMGISTAVLFFVSLVAHELAHSVVARRKGVPVESITLFIFGGVARITRDPEKPGDEFLIAAAGPALSFLLCALFFGVYVASEFVGSTAPAAMFAVLAFVNFGLGSFNLLPGYPLDGGRILRSAVWKATGDPLKATRVAANGGRIIAASIVGLGLYRTVIGQSFGGVWLILIGVFVFQMASAAHRRARAEGILAGVTVSEVMSASPDCISGNTRLDEAVDGHFVPGRYSAYPVVGVEDVVEGILTLHHVKNTPREAWALVTVRQIMTPVSDEITVDPSDRLTTLIEKAQRNPIGRFLVLDGEKLVGIVSFSDISRRLRVSSLLKEGGA